MKFKDYEYIRPNVEDIKKQLIQLTENINNAVSFEEVNKAIQEYVLIDNEFGSMASLASIRNTINTQDEFYEQEQEFFDTVSPELAEYFQNLNLAIYNSKFRAELVEKYGSKIFREIEVDLKTFKPEIIEDLQIENKLTTKYDKLKASAQIEFDGKVLPLPGLSIYLQDKDRNVRKNAEEAVCNFYKEHEDEFDEIYDELVKVRTRIAKKLGYENFVELGYYRMGRTDYDSKMVANYREQILKHVVPLANKIYKLQSDRTNISDLKSYDLSLTYLNGNPLPKGTTEEKVEKARVMYHELSKETGEFFDFMVEHELFDLDSKKGKAGGGYCTYMPKWRSPFIFSNFNNTAGDIDVLTHEAGHAFQVYCSRDAILPNYIWPTMESCEIHSMSMEFFTYPWMNLFFDDVDKRIYAHLTDSITFLPYGVTVDEFQHVVYSKPEMTKEERKAAWREIERKYSPYKVYENDLLERGGWWYRQGHIFSSPFYYIDYTLAQVCAHQFFVKDMENHEKAWQDYYHLCKLGGSKTFLELLKEAHLENPFEDGSLTKTMNTLEKWIDNFDKSKLN